MKRKTLSSVLAVVIIIVAGKASYASSNGKKISVRINKYNAKLSTEEAKKLAFAHSKVAHSEAKMTRLILGKENKKLVYEIEFRTPYKEYKYDIDANTGKIISYSYKDREFAGKIDIGNMYSPIAPSPAAPPMEVYQKDDKAGHGEREYGAVSSKESHLKKVAESRKIELISDEEAKEIMMSKISKEKGRDAVQNTVIERLVIRYEDGKFVYIGKLIYADKEHNFKLNAATGRIIE